MKQIAEVLVFRGTPQTYTYEINKNSNIEEGSQVIIGFGSSKCSGIVLKKKREEASTIKLKEILEVELDKPVMPEDLLVLLNWFKNYYYTTPYKAYQTIMGIRKIRPVKKELKSEIKKAPYDLNIEQQQAIKKLEGIQKPGEALLYGVTGSGKTELYMQMANKSILEKKQAIILLPEIALTPQFLSIFRERFGNRIALMHSGLTKKQKDIEWTKIYKQEVDIVLGPRSAIFAPFKNIGLIVIDECHDSAYKQEQHPRYDVYTVAKSRCCYHKALLIRGSATPPIEAYYQALKQNTCIRLEKRVNRREMPKVEIIDMPQQQEMGEKEAISLPLRKAIQEKLEKKEKCILLINRRGFAPYIYCGNCKKVHQCEGCNLSYTYHADKRFRCHRCQNYAPVTHTCKHCGEKRLTFSGFGTQSIMSDLKQFFPKANLIRFDRDTAKNAKSCENCLKKFREEGDILVGTQMIAKGHHIESVTFVAIIGIEGTLNLPDFRCAEKSFQLLTQVAGRAGRGDKSGQVMIQTHQAEHYAIQFAEEHNYLGFYEQELAFRDALDYPPYTRLIHLIISCEDLSLSGPYLQGLNSYFRKEIKSEIKDEVQIIGPKPAPIEKVRGYRRWQYIFKIKEERFNELAKIISNIPKSGNKIRVIMDLDPEQVM
eukprot:COSAG01_NODE_14_length_41020_cov_40.702133_35_plen_654_part_00